MSGTSVWLSIQGVERREGATPGGVQGYIRRTKTEDESPDGSQKAVEDDSPSARALVQLYE